MYVQTTHIHTNYAHTHKLLTQAPNGVRHYRSKRNNDNEGDDNDDGDDDSKGGDHVYDDHDEFKTSIAVIL